MNLDTAIDMAWNRRGNPYGDDGFITIRNILGLEGNQIKIATELEDMKKQGYDAIPGEGCENHDAGHCKGHVKRGVNARKLHV
jgi:hypothetical protein